ncbi:hypothetical protein [Nitrosomonas sp. Nm166]|nr:hypothetical protein [Nitrosomonas sp. Nm166]
MPRRQRRTAQRLFECLQVEGYQGSKVSAAVCAGLETTSATSAIG